MARKIGRRLSVPFSLAYMTCDAEGRDEDASALVSLEIRLSIQNPLTLNKQRQGIPKLAGGNYRCCTKLACLLQLVLNGGIWG